MIPRPPSSGHHRQSRAARPAGLWHDHRAVESPQRRPLRTQHHDSCDGHLLWRHCAGHRRHHGMEEGNTFATPAFISYGFFWLSLVALIVLPKIIPALTPRMKFPWPRISRCGDCSRRDVPRHVPAQPRAASRLRTLTVLFFSARHRRCHRCQRGLKHFTGVEGLVCGFAAIYTGLAQVLNELAGKIILPLAS